MKTHPFPLIQDLIVDNKLVLLTLGLFTKKHISGWKKIAYSLQWIYTKKNQSSLLSATTTTLLVLGCPLPLPPGKQQLMLRHLQASTFSFPGTFGFLQLFHLFRSLIRFYSSSKPVILPCKQPCCSDLSFCNYWENPGSLWPWRACFPGTVNLQYPSHLDADD